MDRFSCRSIELEGPALFNKHLEVFEEWAYALSFYVESNATESLVSWSGVVSIPYSPLKL